MLRAQIGRFTGSQAIDFSDFAPDVVGILLEFTNVDGDKFAVTIHDTCGEELALQLEALLDDIANKRGGLPVTPELWELHPQLMPDPSPEFDPPLFAKGDPHETASQDAQPPQTPRPPRIKKREHRRHPRRRR